MTDGIKNNRYSRQMLFTPIGQQGQKKLTSSKVAVIGIGALGTVISNHLTRAGIGSLILIDRDFVETSNLQRQMLFTEEDTKNNLPKAIAAQRALQQINSEVHLEAVISDLNASNIEEYLTGADLIIDGTDNFQTRYLINDYSVKYSIPWIYGGAVSSRGMVAGFHPPHTPCYRCLFPNIPTGRGETCDTSGVISPITDIIASYQSTLALKFLVSPDQMMKTNLTQFDIWFNDYMDMDFTNGKNPQCRTCVKHDFTFLNESDEGLSDFTTLCGRNTVQISPKAKCKFDLDDLEEKFSKVGKIERNPFLLKVHINNNSLTIFPNGRVLVQGTDDIEDARKIYAKYIGH